MIPENRLPLKKKLSKTYLTSYLIACLTSIVSISSLFLRDDFYQTEGLIQTFVTNDVINLSIGIPILLLSIFWTKRGKLIGLLFWKGALAFNLYIFITYSLALPLSWISVLYISLVFMDIGTLVKLWTTIDGDKIEMALRNQVHEKFCGAILTGFGILFLFRAILILFSAIQSGEIQSKIELATNITDFIFAPVFILIGISLWKKKALGYVGGLGLLFLVSMLFVGLIFFLILQPILTNTPFSPMDLIMISILGAISFLPLILFVRGIRLASCELQ
jgi:hypothetical protein